MHASVIVVSYNSRGYLDGCLDSLITQLDPDDELIVVDNGSTDGSAEFVAAQYPQVRLLRSENVGYAGGNNRGAEIARGDYLVFLNPDTIVMPGALSALVAPLRTNPRDALSTACIVFMDRPEVINTCGNTMHYTGLTYCRGAGRPVGDYAQPVEVDAVSGAAFAIRRQVFEELGGFDERFFMYVEDTDLSLRARLAGYRCLYVPAAVIKHDYRPAYSPNKAFYLERNRHLMLLKNLTRATYLRLLPGLALSEVVTWGYLLLKGARYWGIKVRVYRWLWQHRGTMVAEAQRTQRRRQRNDREVVGQMTHRLEFDQLANRHLSRAAELLFHPAFWLAHRVLAHRVGMGEFL